MVINWYEWEILGADLANLSEPAGTIPHGEREEFSISWQQPVCVSLH